MHTNKIRNSHATTLLLLLTATLATKKIQAQWDIEESHTTASLRGIHNVGGGVAWASGTSSASHASGTPPPPPPDRKTYPARASSPSKKPPPSSFPLALAIYPAST